MLYQELRSRMTETSLCTLLYVTDRGTMETVALQCAVKMIGLRGRHSVVFWFAEGLSGVFTVEFEDWNKAVRTRLVNAVRNAYNENDIPF